MRFLLIFVLLSAASVAQDSAAQRAVRIEAVKGVTINGQKYCDPNDLYTFDLSCVDAEEIMIANKDVRPGITSMMNAITGNDIVIAIMTTKIRPDYPKDSSLLDKTMPENIQAAELFGDDYELIDWRRGADRYTQTILLHEGYEPNVFPFGVTQNKLPVGHETLGVHREFVRSGHLVEIAFILKNDGAATDELRKRGTDMMNRLVQGLQFTDGKAKESN